MLQIPALAALNSEEVSQAVAFAAQRVLEEFPELETRGGALRSLVLHLHGALGAGLSSLNESLRQEISLAQLTPTRVLKAEEPALDLLLANFRVSRQVGTQAAGPVTLVLRTANALVVPAGTVFTASGGRRFLTLTSFAAKSSSSELVESTDRLLRVLPGGGWALTIDVQAEAVGTLSQLQRGDALSTSASLDGFIRALAQEDFTGGADPDTSQSLLLKLQSSLAGRNACTQAGIEATLQEAYPQRTFFVNLAGHGDPEQQRYHYLWPIAVGGRVDVYVRSQALPQLDQITATATLVEKRTPGGLWQAALSRDAAPGFYWVPRVLPAGAAPDSQSGYEVTSLVRGLDPTIIPGQYLPDLSTAQEAAFSRYSTAAVRFWDTDTDTTDLTVFSSTRSYDLLVQRMPLVRELQDLLGGPAVRDAGGDVLVKGAVPCFVSVSFTVYQPTGVAAPDLAAIRLALAQVVNSQGFTGRLAASRLSQAAHALLSPRAVLGPIDLFGRLLQPDGTWRNLHSESLLEAPDEPQLMVTSRTIVFILDPDDVGINVVASG